MYAKYPHPRPIERAIKLVASKQLPVRYPQPLQFETHIYSAGWSWVPQAIEGTFNRTVAISYPSFKFPFTIWMLGKADSHWEQLKAKGTDQTTDSQNTHRLSLLPSRFPP